MPAETSHTLNPEDFVINEDGTVTLTNPELCTRIAAIHARVKDMNVEDFPPNGVGNREPIGGPAPPQPVGPAPAPPRPAPAPSPIGTITWEF